MDCLLDLDLMQTVDSSMIGNLPESRFLGEPLVTPSLISKDFLDSHSFLNLSREPGGTFPKIKMEWRGIWDRLTTSFVP